MRTVGIDPKDGALLPAKFAAIDTATNGDNAIVAAVAGKKILVLSLSLFSGGTAVDVYLSSKDNTGTKLLGGTGKITLDKTGATGFGGFALGFSPVGHFETDSGEALNLNLSAGNRVLGQVVYVEK